MTRWAAPLVLVGLWEGLGRLAATDPKTALLLPLPSAIAIAAWGLLGEGDLVRAALRSSLRVGVGGLLAVLVGVPLGATIGAAPRLGPALEAPLRLVRPVPPVAWGPLALLWFGVGERAQIAVLGFAAAVVVATGTAHAVAGVPPSLLVAAKNLGASATGVTLRVAVPAALPGVAAAIREGVGTAWFVLVAAEFLAASEGLGVLILQGRDVLEPARSFVGMGALAAAGALTDLALAALGRRLTGWL